MSRPPLSNAECRDLIEHFELVVRLHDEARDELMKLPVRTATVMVDLLKRVRLKGRPGKRDRDKIREQALLARGRRLKREQMTEKEAVAALTADGAGDHAAGKLQREFPAIFGKLAKGTIKDRFTRRGSRRKVAGK